MEKRRMAIEELKLDDGKVAVNAHEVDDKNKKVYGGSWIVLHMDIASGAGLKLGQHINVEVTFEK